MPELQDERDLGRQSDKKQASLLQSEYDGGHYFTDGQYILCYSKYILTIPYS